MFHETYRWCFCAHQCHVFLFNNSITLLTHVQFVIHCFCLSGGSLFCVWTNCYSHLCEYIPLVVIELCLIFPGHLSNLSQFFWFLFYPSGCLQTACLSLILSVNATNTFLSLLPSSSWKYWSLPDIGQTSVIPIWHNPTIFTPNHWQITLKMQISSQFCMPFLCSLILTMFSQLTYENTMWVGVKSLTKLKMYDIFFSSSTHKACYPVVKWN